MTIKKNPLIVSGLVAVLGLILAVVLPVQAAKNGQKQLEEEVDSFFELMVVGGRELEARLEYIENNWKPNFIPMAIEVIYLNNDRRVVSRMIDTLAEKTGQDFGYNIDGWYTWLWDQKLEPHPYYADFKAALYALIDPRFTEYFSSDRNNRIKLDEVRWGGVRQDGIPPLRQPNMISAAEAKYLQDDHIVFGLEVNGDVRAYPKRILAWHEMFVDTVGGVDVAGVYCTLCGSMILYDTKVDGVVHQMGTSGFLYRSNKLMYDKDTQSLWNTLWGEPVIGPLVGQGIEFKKRSVVTTTWGEWKKRHPNTQVLSLDTGYVRDYSEGAAYREYFATDELMFIVPDLDQRLANKADVVGLVPHGKQAQPLALSVDYLNDNPVYRDKVGDQEFVALSDNSGAVRLYEYGGVDFESWDQDTTLVDTSGRTWTLSEQALTANNGDKLYRLPSHRAFWFGWYSAFPQTRLVN